MRSKRSRISAGDGTDHTLHPAREAVAAMREEELGMVAGAEIDTLHALDAGTPERPFGGPPQIEVPVGDQIILVEARHFGADFVTARPDRRPDDRRLPRVSQRGHAGCDD